jgi:hypothetical protein
MRFMRLTSARRALTVWFRSQVPVSNREPDYQLSNLSRNLSVECLLKAFQDLIP